MQPLRIATVEDLVHVLDEHPHWLEALRSRLLTRELLELPQKLAEFAAATERRFEVLERQLDQLRTDTERRFDALERQLDQLRTDTESRFDASERQLDQLRTDTERRFEVLERQLDQLRTDTERRFEVLERQLDQLRTATERRFDALERQLDQLRTDVAPLKAAHARNAARHEVDLMAEEQGLAFVRTLDREEIRDLVRSSDTDGISKQELRSFRLADIVLCATDHAGAECYVAVEVSYTANGRDTSRAQRNARFLTRFTGRRAYAVVAGLRFDERIRRSVESGAIAWYQLDPEVLEVD